MKVYVYDNKTTNATSRIINVFEELEFFSQIYSFGMLAILSVSSISATIFKLKTPFFYSLIFVDSIFLYLKHCYAMSSLAVAYRVARKSLRFVAQIISKVANFRKK